MTELKLGSNTGNKVFFDGKLVNRYPKKDGYYGIITGCAPARNYNLMAKYHVDAMRNGKYVYTVVCEWGDITDKE